MEKSKKDVGSEEIEDAGSSDRGAVILNPEPPRRGTFALLVPGDLGWDVRRDAGVVRLDFRPMTRRERRDAYRGRMQDDGQRRELARDRAEGKAQSKAARDDEEGVR